MKGKIKVILVSFLVLYLVMEIFLPVLVEKEIRTTIIDNTDSVQQLEIDAKSFPAWEMLLTKVDRVEINASNLVLDGLFIDSIFTKHRNVYIEDSEIKGENIDLKFVITEDALNKYIAAKYPDLSNFRVKFVSDQAFLSGQINFFNNKVDIQLTGKFKIKEKNIISFKPLNLKIEELEIPASVIERFIEDTGFTINLNEISIPLNVENIKIDSSCLYLLGGIYAERAGL